MSCIFGCAIAVLNVSVKLQQKCVLLAQTEPGRTVYWSVQHCQLWGKWRQLFQYFTTAELIIFFQLDGSSLEMDVFVYIEMLKKISVVTNFSHIGWWWVANCFTFLCNLYTLPLNVVCVLSIFKLLTACRAWCWRWELFLSFHQMLALW